VADSNDTCDQWQAKENLPGPSTCGDCAAFWQKDNGPSCCMLRFRCKEASDRACDDWRATEKPEENEMRDKYKGVVSLHGVSCHIDVPQGATEKSAEPKEAKTCGKCHNFQQKDGSPSMCLKHDISREAHDSTCDEYDSPCDEWDETCQTCTRLLQDCDKWKAKEGEAPEPCNVCSDCMFFVGSKVMKWGACIVAGMDAPFNTVPHSSGCDNWKTKVPPGPLDRTGPERRYILRKRIGHQYIYSDERGHFMRQWKDWECELMNILDWRYWGCECEYMSPYGLVISADCEKHD